MRLYTFIRFRNFSKSFLSLLTVPNGRMPDDIMENMKDSLPEKDFNGAKTLPSDSQTSGSRVVTSQGSRSSTATITQSKSLVRIGWQHMGLIVRKAVLGVSDQFMLKHACPATETN